MKRKLFTAFVILGALSLTACQEDTAMEELILDTELTATDTGDGEPEPDKPPGGGDTTAVAGRAAVLID